MVANMTTRHIAAGVIGLLVVTATADAQTRQAGTNQNRQGQTQFNAQDRQATSDWSNQHKANPPVGFRSQDQLSPALESRLQVGSKLDPQLQKRVRPVPTDLRRQL